MNDDELVERIARAMRSTHLEHGRSDRTSAIDYAAALGHAGAVTEVGANLLRLDAVADAETIRTALAATRSIVRMLAARRGWSVTPMRINRWASEALFYFLAPACDQCSGRQWVMLDSLPRPCPVCNGSGLRPWPDRYRREISGIVDVLTSLRATAAAEVTARIRGRRRGR